MNRLGQLLFSKKGGVLVLLALIICGGGWLFSQERSGGGGLTPYLFAKAASPLPAREIPGSGPKETKGWKLAPFWVPLVHQEQPTLTEIRVALQVAAPFSPDEGTASQRTLRETVWSVLRAPEENLLQAAGKNRLQENLTVRLNENIFQGTLKGVLLEILPWS
jgi:flagellar basal body-associated protein FliL